MTTLDQEREEQRRWVLLPRFAHMKGFDVLLEHEFLSPQQIGELQNEAIRNIVAFAAEQVPHYRWLFHRRQMRTAEIRSIKNLPRLPILTRWELIEQAEALKARKLPPGESVYGDFASSGTTGRRTQVTLTRRSNAMYTLLRQRASRWRKTDPLLPFAEIRAAHVLPPHPDGTPCSPDGQTQWPRWRYEGSYFHTGPYRSIGLSHGPQKLMDWLCEQDAGYLLTYPSVLEEMCFASPDRPPCPTLRGVISSSVQLPATLRRRIERTFGVPTSENYGLNEIGTVATRCEADRFHVHVEHCAVEIVDENAIPCLPGERGRILVTGLTNHAMPLLRYDTDDSAVVPTTPCPCGRSLPSFTGLEGRIRRYSTLPPGTRKRFDTLLLSFERIPPQSLRDLRRYQVHQYRDGRFELRLVSTKPLSDEVQRAIMAAWEECSKDDHVELELSIVRVDDIPLPPSGKRLDFTSDFFADMVENGDAA